MSELSIPPLSYSHAEPAEPPVKKTGAGSESQVPQKPVTVRPKAKGLLQGFGYFNPGLGAMYGASINAYENALNHPAYGEMKAEYSPTVITDDKPDLSSVFHHWSFFVDLGQFRLGHDLSNTDQTLLLRESYLTDNFYLTYNIRELTVEMTKQNYGWLSLSLLSFGEKDNPVFFTLWLDYALDRYNFTFKGSSYSYYPYPTPEKDLNSEALLGSGGGWGHRIAADIVLTSSEGRPGRGEFAWFLSLQTGYNFGQLSDAANGWRSRLSAWTTGISFGVQFNHTGAQTKYVDCPEQDTGHGPDGDYCDLTRDYYDY
ncbi:MAG: hypothetical protein JW873_04885 [Candidatus Saganbacteria bacterium]|nr:hypothetical protein [Candidatus Saganbacteria bacterium]